MAQCEWYERFFTGIVLDLWENACSQDQTQAEIEMIERLLLLESGAKVLDVPCGQGRHLLEMASRGYSVTGVDLSEEAISRASARLQRRDTETEIVKSDMRQISWRDRYDGAICMGNSLGYFDRSGMTDFFEGVSRSLKRGGKFLIDTGMAAESILPALDERNWVQLGDILMLISNEYDVSESCLCTEFTFIREDERKSGATKHFVYTVSEISAMLRAVGLNPEGLFSNPQLEPYSVGSPRLLLLAEKND
jgi:SAM-dependent methyltransferase